MSDSISLKSGKCPKCAGMEVYSDKDKDSRHNERAYMMVSAATGFTVDTYFCFNCGYFEEYFCDKDIKDAKILEKIMDKWEKVESR